MPLLQPWSQDGSFRLSPVNFKRASFKTPYPCIFLVLNIADDGKEIILHIDWTHDLIGAIARMANSPPRTFHLDPTHLAIKYRPVAGPWAYLARQSETWQYRIRFAP
jgi:hypothetical protein